MAGGALWRYVIVDAWQGGKRRCSRGSNGGWRCRPFVLYTPIVTCERVVCLVLMVLHGAQKRKRGIEGNEEREVYCLWTFREIIVKGIYNDSLSHVDHIILSLSCYHYTSSVMFPSLVPEQTRVIRALPFVRQSCVLEKQLICLNFNGKSMLGKAEKIGTLERPFLRFFCHISCRLE